MDDFVLRNSRVIYYKGMIPVFAYECVLPYEMRIYLDCS